MQWSTHRGPDSCAALMRTEGSPASLQLCCLVSSLLGALIRSALHGRPDGPPADMLLTYERDQHLGVCHWRHFQGLLLLEENKMFGQCRELKSASAC